MRARFTVIGILAAAVVTAGSGISAAQAETGRPAAPTKPLVRYFDGLKHYVTSGGSPGAAYREEGRTPILTTKTLGLTKAIYGCRAGNTERDQFLTGDAGCENSVHDTGNNTFLRQEGYLYTRQLPGTKPLYRCYVPHTKSHFVSVRGDCERTPTSNVVAEHILGYFPAAGR
ncbi:hypothetical protein SAMN05444920_109111 [Nonomuraea solani]|uniref:Phospholipase A2 n=1 Tax=Nonomuraea solani TaxID=1144553 RepID=A0A1H6ECW8_9ACTN|nr:hypothetical protein SAMN05444920_109111 [Nonomuraea solani]